MGFFDFSGFLFQTLPVHILSFVLMTERGKERLQSPPFDKRKNVKRPTSPEDVQKVFDCYCKKILKNEAINIQKHYQRMNDLQISFSELMPEQLVELSTYDDYSTDYDLYKVMGYDVKIKNELLSESLQELSEEERFILLLYGLGFNDGEIADLLKIVRRTVNYKRQRGFEKVRKRMEEKQHEEE